MECTLYALANSSSKTLVNYEFAKAMKKVANVGHLFLFFRMNCRLKSQRLRGLLAESGSFGGFDNLLTALLSGADVAQIEVVIGGFVGR